WNYTPICTTNASSNPTSWTPAGGFTLLNGDILWTTDNGFPEASQYELQASQASVTPSITAVGETATGDCFMSLSVAVKAANNGTATPSSIHVAKIVHESWITPHASPVKIQAPTVGNLRVLVMGFPTTVMTVTGVTSDDGCSWSSATTADGPPIWYAQNCSPDTAGITSITYSSA